VLSVNQISALRENEEYKKTRGWRYNWKYSKAVRSHPDFSISIDICANGTPYKQLGNLAKALIWLRKGYIISKEIGEYRNEVVERILDASIQK